MMRTRSLPTPSSDTLHATGLYKVIAVIASIIEITVSNERVSTFSDEINVAKVSGIREFSTAFKFLFPSLNSLKRGGALSLPYIMVSSKVAA